MKTFLLRSIFSLILLFTIIFIMSAFGVKPMEKPDKVYLFAYSTLKNNGKNGLHFAWSTDQKNWFAIGPEFSFLKSDFGSWGPTGKSMSEPFLIRDNAGIFHCFWSVKDNVFAHSESKDLVTWGRQNYIQGMKNFVGKGEDKSNIQNVQVSQKEGQYLVHFSES